MIPKITKRMRISEGFKRNLLFGCRFRRSQIKARALLARESDPHIILIMNDVRAFGKVPKRVNTVEVYRALDSLVTHFCRCSAQNKLIISPIHLPCRYGPSIFEPISSHDLVENVRDWSSRESGIPDHPQNDV